MTDRDCIDEQAKFRHVLGASRVPPTVPPFDVGNEWNITTVMANSTAALNGFSKFIGHLKAGSELDERVREIAILRVSALLRSDYAWGRHVPRARALGMSDEEIAAVRDGDFRRLLPEERAAAFLAEAVEVRTITDAVWSDAARFFTPSQLVELTMLSGCYGMVSRFTVALGLPLDDDIAGLESP